MEEESIAVESSVENGNVPVEELDTTPAPSAETVTETTPAVEPELFDLPDGRKVDAATLSKEFKDNFLPEFTRKSQELAQLKQGTSQINTTPEKPYQNPEWTPQSYQELIEIAKNEVKSDFEQQEKAKQAQYAALNDAVSNELAELKKADSSLNENALFLHANEYREKYGVSFPNLTAAYNHMKDVQQLTKSVQQDTVKNIAKRADPVSTTQGAVGQKPDPSMFENARDYLRSIKS